MGNCDFARFPISEEPLQELAHDRNCFYWVAVAARARYRHERGNFAVKLLDRLSGPPWRSSMKSV